MNTPLKDIAINIGGGIGLVIIISIFSYLTGPLKWIINSRKIKRLILQKRDFKFVYNPESGRYKFITFSNNGQIGSGQNQNEYFWKIKKGKLEIFTENKELYSRFKYDNENGKLIHTNESDTRSIQGQYFVPQWIPNNKRNKTSHY